MQNTLLSADQVAALLEEIAKRMELSGAPIYKVRAYETAAMNLRTVFEPLDEIVAQGKLETIPGVGKAIAEKIEKLHNTGTHPALEFYRQQYPAGLLEVMRIPGLGSKRAISLYEKLKLSNIDEVVAACESGTLAKTKGFGPYLQSKILGNVEMARNSGGLIRLNRASAAALRAVEMVKERYPGFRDVIVAGDVRRGCEVCRGIVLVAHGDDAAVERFKASVAGIITAPTKQFGAALLFATGSEEHVEALTQLAAKAKLSLTPNGLFRGKTLVAAEKEEQIYAALSLPYIEPELREGRAEIERARQGKAPKLVTHADLRGVLHFHTDFSDGINTLEEMADAAREMGLQYAGVCDHSQAASYAGGLKFDKVLAQHKLADALNARHENFRVFKGIESDILRDGSLDYSPEQLASFDFVVASIHGRFQLSKKDQTQRIIRAVQNPFTTILGHPTGRLLLRRMEYDVDLDAILKACADHGVAVEINGDPHRLDLDWRWHQRALELGCIFSIDPDAHDIAAYSYLKWGTLMARKGGVPAERTLNCMDLKSIAKHFERRRLRSSVRRKRGRNGARWH